MLTKHFGSIKTRCKFKTCKVIEGDEYCFCNFRQKDINSECEYFNCIFLDMLNAVTTEHLSEILLDTYFPKEIEQETAYTINHDDCPYSTLSVAVSCDGDAWISINDYEHRVHSEARFRTNCGGGRKLRVRQALVLLALAIKLDGGTTQNGK